MALFLAASRFARGFAPVARTRVGGGRAGARALLRSTAADVAPVDGGTDYSSTVLLPDTAFPQRADSSNRERAIQEYWRENEARGPTRANGRARARAARAQVARAARLTHLRARARAS